MTSRCYFVPTAYPPSPVTDFDAGQYQWWAKLPEGWVARLWMNGADGEVKQGQGFSHPVREDYLEDAVSRGTMVRVW